MNLRGISRRVEALAREVAPDIAAETQSEHDARMTSGELRAELGRLYARATGVDVDIAECITTGLPDEVIAWADELEREPTARAGRTP